MLKHRVIPALLLQNDGLVKTTKFSKPKYVGDPINAIRIFNEKEVDELVVLDILAGKGNQGPNLGLIESFAGECFMPLCYGGGIRSFDQARQIFDLGVEKICIQTAALENADLITQVAREYGSQAVVVSIDVKRGWLGRPKLYSAARGKVLAKPWLRHLQDVVQAGCGEVLINAVDRDGMMQGMDLELIQAAASAVPVPVIAVGGAGNPTHFRQAVEAGASAVAAGAYFVFFGPHRAVLITYPLYEELEELLGALS